MSHCTITERKAPNIPNRETKNMKTEINFYFQLFRPTSFA